MREMRLALCFAIALALLASTRLPSSARRRTAGAPAPQAPQQEKPQVFRAGVEVVSLNVTVIDSQGRYVTDLEQDDFSVFEDGAKQELTFFNRTNLPIALSLLIDSSASMEQRMENAQEAAIGFAKKIRAAGPGAGRRLRQPRRDQAGVHQQGRRARDARFARTSAGGSTALHNAVYISLKELAKVKAKNPDEIRRQAIVVLSDGEDTSSLVSFEEVLELAKRSETAIYTIGLQPRETSALRGLPRGRVRAAPAGAGNRRPRVLRAARSRS